MDNTVYEYKETSLKEIIGILCKNKYFIATFLLAGMLIGLGFVGIRMIQNPVEYRYQAKVTIELVNGAKMKNQPQTMLRVLESSTVLEDSLTELKIDSGKYIIKTDGTSKANHFDVIAEGPDKDLVVNLVTEVVDQARSTANPSMNMKTNKIVEKGHLFGSPIKISKGVISPYYVIISMLLFGLLSLFLIVIIRSISGNILMKDEVEEILDTKILASIPYEGKNRIYDKYFKVR